MYRRLCQIFRFVESSALVTALAAMILLTVLQIILRNFLSLSISWVEPLNQHLVLVIAFLGAMVAGRRAEHISFDALKPYLPNKLAWLFQGCGAFLSAIICLYLVYICGKMTYLDYLDPLPAFAHVPQWIFELFIPLGFLVIAYRLIKQVFVKRGTV